MDKEVFFWTSFIAALSLTIALKFLQFFHFIDWSPVEKLESGFILTSHQWLIKWLLLGIIIWGLCLLHMLITQAFPWQNATFISIGLTVVYIFLITQYIQPKELEKDFWEQLSLPLLAVLAIVIRFMSGTVLFFRELSKK